MNEESSGMDEGRTEKDDENSAINRKVLSIRKGGEWMRKIVERM